MTKGIDFSQQIRTNQVYFLLLPPKEVLDIERATNMEIATFLGRLLATSVVPVQGSETILGRTEEVTSTKRRSSYVNSWLSKESVRNNLFSGFVNSPKGFGTGLARNVL